MRTELVSGFGISKRLMSSCVAIAAIGLVAPRPADAAFLLIDDTLANETIDFSINDFDAGFSLDGSQVQIGLGNPRTVNVPELDAAGAPVTHSFSGFWDDSGATQPTSGTIAFTEGGNCCSDILTYTHSTNGAFGHLNGTFSSDAGPGLLPLPAGATLFAEGPPFDFSNAFISASARSDVSEVPAPPALLLFGPALLGLGFLRCRRDLILKNSSANSRRPENVSSR